MVVGLVDPVPGGEVSGGAYDGAPGAQEETLSGDLWWRRTEANG